MTTRIIATVLCTTILLTTISTVAAEDKWELIFDGKTWGDWKPNERPESWKIEDGCLVGNGERSHVFFVREELQDFELKAEVMINEGGNSGIYFHIAHHEEGWFFDGHEVQVNNTHGDPVKTGSLWGVVKLYDAPVKDNEWFEMHIVVKGQTIDVFINDKPRLTYVEPEGIQGPRKISKGYLALQAHDPGSVVRYRNIRLKKLARPEATKSSQLLPEPAPGWNIELLAEAPLIQAPTAVVQADDGTIYLAQDPMDMNGPSNVPADSVITLRWTDGIISKQIFADQLGAVMGLELVGNTLFVAHAPYLTALRDTDGDAIADQRIDLIEGLGPANPAFNGYNDHVISGIRAGIDGFLYVTFGDKGIPEARARDGTVLSCRGGGVFRVRPDGSDAEIVATGLRNPLSPAIDRYNNVFTYGNDDDSKQWPNAVFHIIDGGHYGYPFEFLDAPHRCLPIITGEIGGAGSLGCCFNEPGLAPQFHGNLFFADWGVQRLFRYELEPVGATFRLVQKSDVVTPGEVHDFRPVAVVVGANGNSLLLTDWGVSEILRSDVTTGRLFRLTWSGVDAVNRLDLPSAGEERATALDGLIDWLDHGSYRVRLRAQRELIHRGHVDFERQETSEVVRVTSRMKEILHRGTQRQRVHALWVLDKLDAKAILSTCRDEDPILRLQAIRSVGNRRLRASLDILHDHLHDPQPAVRREAAIALGRIGAEASTTELLLALGDEDRFVSWSIVTALKRIDHWNAESLASAILQSDGRRQQQLIDLTAQVWREPIVRCWSMVLQQATSHTLRTRACQILSGLYYKHGAWDGHWWGTNPLVGRRTTPDVKWSEKAADLILHSLRQTLDDESLREIVVESLIAIGQDANPILSAALENEASTTLACTMIAAVGRTEADRYVDLFAQLVENPNQSMVIRREAIDALCHAVSDASTRALLAQVVPKSPGELLVASLPELARRNCLSEVDLVQYAQHRNGNVRAAALQAISMGAADSESSQPLMLAGLSDPEIEVQHAAILAAGNRRNESCITALVELYEQELGQAASNQQFRDDIIMSLTAMPDASALEVYLQGLTTGEPSIQTACFQALSAIWPQLPLATRRRVREDGIEPAAAPYLQRLYADFRPLADWHVIGPFPREIPRELPGRTGFDYAQPWFGLNGQVVRWQLQPTDDCGEWSFDAQAVSNDLLGFDDNNSSQINVFAHTIVDSAAERDAFLLVGSSGPLTIWVNGRSVYRFDDLAGRPFLREQDIVPLRLRAGPNELLVKSRIGVGPWRAAVQLAAPEPSEIVMSSGEPKRHLLAEYAQQHQGEATRGKVLFFDAQKGRCSKCHSIRGEGGRIGPDLATFATKYDRAEAIRSVLEPSARLAQGYIPVVVATDEGRVFSGIVQSETAMHLNIVNADGKLTRVERDAIEERRPTHVSVMPNGLADHLNAGEFTDLVDFLMTLR